MRAPAEFVEFCVVQLDNRVAGVPLIKTELAPVVWREGPMTVPEATPKLTPELSPVVWGMVVAKLCAGQPMKRIFMALLTPAVAWAMLG
ncbi:hypothetical protein XSR1_10175 [Xenorhabdus szentirmaii DSM 16338]|uniref:Uncharacterized protein n=1 Tax=Xenorhabdus szentirmaii DSM 16338 TaxID=1427518 RepID=W1IQE2_9GAMM|nr:hypothetical protein XSR1_10175 [Xenorhabdus szentirmaii DSM 16338]